MLTLWIVCSIINLIVLPIVFRNERLAYGTLFLYVMAIIVSPLLTLTLLIGGIFVAAVYFPWDAPVFKEK